ncbi:TetR/AcrR family transcriptional regulator [Streptococcus oriscaviae]|uniref:TetR/AcrR family transcriptional regulator n=1 Tax=Streptococcus oriscaviae TaxID=2781599 RepID=A0ABX7YM17_9STRE|nr:TetR/AcrR family transcriptional regulator [Streptococcus oriscaviae]QUE54304.1 TetR/AcrR family transcriptional regulator [Streptococcus oriscaviae]
MSTRKISPISLKNLTQSNKEVNQLTRESIETALLFLLERKEMKHISVSELVRKAGVSRNAFYRNYKSKEEILELYYERTSQSVKEKWNALQKKVQQDGVQQSFSDFLHHQMEKTDYNKAISNVSQWIKEKTKRG